LTILIKGLFTEFSFDWKRYFKGKKTSVMESFKKYFNISNISILGKEGVFNHFNLLLVFILR
jgi:hypothetical protein